MQIKDRQQLLLIVTISVAALFVADKVLLTPLLNAWDARQTRMAGLRKQVTQGKALMANAQGIRNYWREISRRSLTNDTSAAEQQIFQAATEWAQESGVSIGAINRQWKVDSDDYSTYECHIDANGDLGHLTRFLWGAEREPLALRFQSIDLNARDKEGRQLSLNLTFSALILTPSTR
jgi:Tfp pilus assembly protein PilO